MNQNADKKTEEKLEKAEKKVAKKIEKQVSIPTSIEEEIMLEAAELERIQHSKSSGVSKQDGESTGSG